MNKIREKFEETEMVDVYWGGQIEYDKESNKYFNTGSAHFEDCDALNQRWMGYQQAVKDMNIKQIKAEAIYNATKTVWVCSAVMSPECFDQLNSIADRVERGDHE
jgi:hypothetical protein